MPWLRTLLVVAGSTLPIASVACSIGETKYETVTLPAKLTTETRTCSSPLATPDLSTLKACSDGKGHCYDATKVPLPPDQLPACDDPTQVCVPDSVFKAGGKKLKTCTFFIGNAPGACVSTLVKQIAQNAAQMQKDVCADDERCAPCISPLDNSDTHLCDDGVGVHEQACVGGTSANDTASCCHGAGVCMTEDGVPAEDRSNLDRETCPAAHLCAPAALTSGNPVKCSVLTFSGVCIDLCFASMFQATTQVTRSSCGPTEVCMPCVLGKSEGLPGCD